MSYIKNIKFFTDNISLSVDIYNSTLCSVWLSPNQTETVHGLWASKRPRHVLFVFGCTLHVSLVLVRWHAGSQRREEGREQGACDSFRKWVVQLRDCGGGGGVARLGISGSYAEVSSHASGSTKAYPEGCEWPQGVRRLCSGTRSRRVAEVKLRCASQRLNVLQRNRRIPVLGFLGGSAWTLDPLDLVDAVLKEGLHLRGRPNTTHQQNLSKGEGQNERPHHVSLLLASNWSFGELARPAHLLVCTSAERSGRSLGIATKPDPTPSWGETRQGKSREGSQAKDQGGEAGPRSRPQQGAWEERKKGERKEAALWGAVAQPESGPCAS